MEVEMIKFGSQKTSVSVKMSLLLESAGAALALEYVIGKGDEWVGVGSDWAEKVGTTNYSKLLGYLERLGLIEVRMHETGKQYSVNWETLVMSIRFYERRDESPIGVLRSRTGNPNYVPTSKEWREEVERYGSNDIVHTYAPSPNKTPREKDDFWVQYKYNDALVNTVKELTESAGFSWKPIHGNLIKELIDEDGFDRDALLSAFRTSLPNLRTFNWDALMKVYRLGGEYSKLYEKDDQVWFDREAAERSQEITQETDPIWGKWEEVVRVLEAMGFNDSRLINEAVVYGNESNLTVELPRQLYEVMDKRMARQIDRVEKMIEVKIELKEKDDG